MERQKITFAPLKKLKEFVRTGKNFIVFDRNTFSLFSEKIFSLTGKTDHYVVASGEEGKDLSSAVGLINALYAAGVRKGDTVVGVGGGVVGDVAGFAAMVYMRGVRLVLVPTTLTSMADAAIGGKNACNLQGTKNMIGGFCLPDQTLIDISFLESLPEREEKSGAGELIKTQLLSGLPVFDTYLGNKEEGIRMAAEYKLGIIEKDFKDTGLRHILNFGHTIGHAIESTEDFKASHGEAVVSGMELTFGVGEYLGIPSGAEGELFRLMSAAGISRCGGYDARSLYEKATMDKKSRERGVEMTFVLKPGVPVMVGVEWSELSGGITYACRLLD